MRKTILGTFIFFVFTSLLQQEAIAQSKNDSSLKVKKTLHNTIRFNITNPLIISKKSLIFGYERTITPNQSFSINIGQAALPVFISADTTIGDVQLQKNNSDKGFHLSGDYRFYLKNENKFQAPRGIYLAPYFSYNFVERKNRWSFDTPDFQGEANTQFTLNMNTIGLEMGYQFVLWRRLALDFVLIGPGVTRYKIATKVDANLSADDLEALYEKLQTALSDKLPGYDLLIDKLKFAEEGSVKTTSVGFRYIIHIGYRF